MLLQSGHVLADDPAHRPDHPGILNGDVAHFAWVRFNIENHRIPGSFIQIAQIIGQ